MRKILIIILIILFALLGLLSVAYGQTTYYVKTGGNDALAGTSDATAWGTITKVNSFQASLVPGDSILFKRGDSFSGTITIGKTGTSGNRIYYGSYGTGALPVITGLSTVQSWTSQGDTIYYASGTVESNPNYIIINGKWYAMGRTPNQDTFLYYNSYTSNTSITDTDLPDSPSWVGSELVIRVDEYKTKRSYAVTAHSAGKLTYAGGGDAGLKNNYGYFFQGDMKTLDTFGEWYFNGTTLYVYFGADDPDDYVVQIPVINNGIYNVTPDRVNYYRHITIDGLSLYGFGRDAIYYQRYTDYAEIKNCSIQFAGYNAINVDTIGIRYGLIDNNYIHNALHSGISAQSSTQCTITNNTIKNTAPWLGVPLVFHRSAGIYSIDNTNSLIQYNRIDSSGYNGIMLNGNNSLVKNNYITNSVSQVHDGGGIYVGGRTYSGREVRDNIVTNTLGITAGSNSAFAWARSIYLDADPTGIIVDGNTVQGGDYGLFLGSGIGIEITNNTAFDGRRGTFMHQDYTGYTTGGRTMTAPQDNIVTGNYFVAKNIGEDATRIQIPTSRLAASYARSDTNYIMRPVSNYDYIYHYNGGLRYEIAGWASCSGFETNSKTSPVNSMSNDNDTMIVMYINPTKVDSTISITRRMMDLDGNAFTGDTILEPYGSAILIYKENPGAPPFLPGVTTNSLVRLTLKTVEMTATLDSTGGGTVSARGFVYSSTNQTPEVGTDSVETVIGTGLGAYSARIRNLSVSTTYYFRAYATNETGSNYGETYAITTPAFNVFKDNAGKVLYYNGKLVGYDGSQVTYIDPEPPLETFTFDNNNITFDNNEITFDQ